MFSTKVGAVARNIATSAAMQYKKPIHGPGSNIPFRIDNPWRLVAVFTVYCGTGFAIPYLIVRHQLLK
nr:PREDICTED: cytochrome c oxidase subunit 7C, mitochondrial-like [Bemisia tabaci]